MLISQEKIVAKRRYELSSFKDVVFVCEDIRDPLLSGSALRIYRYGTGTLYINPLYINLLKNIMDSWFSRLIPVLYILQALAYRYLKSTDHSEM